MTSATVRVLIADDSFVVRTGLRDFVASLPGFEVVGEASSGRDAVAQAQSTRPDVVLMDLRMRDGDGIVATRELAASAPATRTLMVSWSDEPDHVRDAFAAGARGYLVHGRFGAGELAQALRTVAAGDIVLTPAVAGQIMDGDRAKANLSPLTPREREILALVRRGRRNREIAVELGVEEKTIKNHLNSIYSKLEIGSRIEAMASAHGIEEGGE
jgi:DNA-binding NarL/FixJ family response regulator